MAGRRPKSTSPNAWRLLAYLCIVLVLVLGVVQAAHSHPDRVFHADCTLCATAHVAVHPTAPPIVLDVTHVEALVEALVLPTRQANVVTFALFTRPPPANASLA